MGQFRRQSEPKIFFKKDRIRQYRRLNRFEGASVGVQLNPYSDLERSINSAPCYVWTEAEYRTFGGNDH